MILTFSWYVETRKTGDTFLACLRLGLSKLSGPMPEVEASSKNFRRLPECDIQFQMMLFESLSHSDFSNGIICVAL